MHFSAKSQRLGELGSLSDKRLLQLITCWECARAGVSVLCGKCNPVVCVGRWVWVQRHRETETDGQTDRDGQMTETDGQTDRDGRTDR